MPRWRRWRGVACDEAVPRGVRAGARIVAIDVDAIVPEVARQQQSVVGNELDEVRVRPLLSLGIGSLAGMLVLPRLTEATVGAMRALGAPIGEGGDRPVVTGGGLRGLRAPEGPIDCMNAGTLMRPLAGILAGQEGRFELVGDESLSKRPMGPTAEPPQRQGEHGRSGLGRAGLG